MKGPEGAFHFDPLNEISDSVAVLQHADMLLAAKNNSNESVIRITLQSNCSVDTAIAGMLAKRILECDTTLDFTRFRSLEDWTSFNWRVEGNAPSALVCLANYATREKHGMPMPCRASQRLGALIKALQYMGDPGGLQASFTALLEDTQLGIPRRTILHPMLGTDLDSTKDFRWKQLRDWIESDYQRFQQIMREGKRASYISGDVSQPRPEQCLLTDEMPGALWRYWCDAGALAEGGIPAEHVIVVGSGGQISQWNDRAVPPLPSLSPKLRSFLPVDLSLVEEEIQDHFGQAFVNDFHLNVTGQDYAANVEAQTNTIGSLSLKSWDLLLGAVPVGIFRFAELELPDSFGDLSDARLKRALQSFLWRMIRPSARIGLPADFEQRHLRSDVGILCSWSRSGMILAYTRSGRAKVDHLAKEFRQLASLSHEASEVLSKMERNSGKIDQAKVQRLICEYSRLRAKLAVPQNRLLRRFWEAVNQQEVIETLWKLWDSNRQAASLRTISSVQVKLEYFEVLIISFYAIELVDLFVGVLFLGSKEKALELLIMAVAGLLLGWLVYRALVDPEHHASHSGESAAAQKARRRFLWVIVVILCASIILSIYYLARHWSA
jgi:hypothetical protein